MGLAGIDYGIIITYLIGVFALGLFFGKYVKSAGDFFAAGKALPFWAIGMSIVIGDVGAFGFVASSGGAYTDGLAIASFDWIGSMPAMVFAAFLFIPYMWRSGVYTIPEFLGRRYNEGVQLIHGFVWGIINLIGLALVLWVAADQLSGPVLGLNPQWVVWGTVLITGAYTLCGGLAATVMVDTVQLIVTYVGGISLLALCMFATGGPVDMHKKVTSLQPVIQFVVGDQKNVQEEISIDAVRGALETAGFKMVDVTDPQDPNKRIASPVRVPNPIPTNKSNRFFARVETFKLPQTDAATPADVRRNVRKHLETTLKPLCGDKELTITQVMSYEGHFNMLLPHDTDKPYPWSGILLGLGVVLAVAYMSVNQTIVQRSLGARSEWHAKGGMIFGGFLKTFIPLMITVPGICALAINPDIFDGDRAVPSLIRTLLPPGVRGLLFVALFAALMSSITASLNAATTLFTNDLIGKTYNIFSGKNFSEKTSLTFGRVLTVVFIVGSAIAAPQFAKVEKLYEFVQGLMTWIQGPTLAIILVGMMWPRATGKAGLASLIAGLCFTTYYQYMWEVDFFGLGITPARPFTEGLIGAKGMSLLGLNSTNPFLFIAWWSFVLSLVVVIVVSLLTKAEPEEKIRGLVWRQEKSDEELQSALSERVQ